MPIIADAIYIEHNRVIVLNTMRITGELHKDFQNPKTAIRSKAETQ